MMRKADAKKVKLGDIITFKGLRYRVQEITNDQDNGPWPPYFRIDYGQPVTYKAVQLPRIAR